MSRARLRTTTITASPSIPAPETACATRWSPMASGRQTLHRRATTTFSAPSCRRVPARTTGSLPTSSLFPTIGFPSCARCRHNRTSSMNGATSSTCSRQVTEALALQAYASLRREFSVGRRRGPRGRGLFYEHRQRRRLRRPLAFNWPFAHALAAAIDVYGLGGGPTRSEIDDLLAGLQRYWDKRPPTGLPAYSSTVVRWFRAGPKFYDDNAWSDST